MPDDWRSIEVLTRAATFRRRPSVRTGDRIVYYAAGKRVVFAAGTVTSMPYQADTDSVWDWHVDVSLTHYVDHLRHGIPLDDVSVDPRDLRRSVRQQSHIRLSDREWEAAVERLPPR